MTHKLFTLGAGIGSALILAASGWGSTNPGRDSGDANGARLTSPQVTIVRDAGDATRAQLALYSPPVSVVRDAGDADAARQAKHLIRFTH
jgi:hypothetical protein